LIFGRRIGNPRKTTEAPRQYKRSTQKLSAQNKTRRCNVWLVKRTGAAGACPWAVVATLEAFLTPRCHHRITVQAGSGRMSCANSATGLHGIPAMLLGQEVILVLKASSPVEPTAAEETWAQAAVYFLSEKTVPGAAGQAPLP
jgi:hypothetical protein